MSKNRRTGFTEWLTEQIARSDPVGDLARDVAEDASWPGDGQEYATYEVYLRRRVVSPESRLALEDAWSEYMDQREDYDRDH